ncbi:MAG: VWA domain-containing protein [Candidatus Neoclostridium sp.]
MQNCAITFSYPWFLLFLIPLALLTFIPYFRIPKKMRRSRNRIVSLVLHIIVVTLSVSVLSGMNFRYTVPNEKNEIILLVDVSDTEQLSADRRDDFVRTVLRQSRYDSYKVGVVTFGFDQKYAVPLTNKTDDVFERYENAELPDVSATNVADALLYAKNLFQNPETGKIVLITDGKETDKEASSVIRAISASGIKVDVANVSSSYNKSDVEIVDVALPDYHINVGEEFNVGVTLSANTDGSASVELYDNGVRQESAVQSVDFRTGTQTFMLRHSFATGGLHELELKIASDSSTLEKNDGYCSYFYLQVFNKILMIGRSDEECEPLKALLTEGNEFEVTVKNILEDDELIDVTADYLRGYDEVILNNIAYSDMPEGFDKELYKYVNTYGGGLLTVGGQDESGDAHSYVRTDMVGTTYQEILPVQAIDYTPPLGVVVVIDRSGSMGTTDNLSGRTYLEWATDGAKSCLNAMSERDYMGIVTLDSNEAVVLPLTPRTQEAKILGAIESIDTANGGTVFAGALQKAGEMLRGEKNISKRHIIVVTDGIVNEKETYQQIIRDNYENEAASITFSVVLVGSKEGSAPAQDMKEAVDIGHGRLYAVTDMKTLQRLMREELKVPEITEVNMETFNPIVFNAASSVFKGVEYGSAEEGGLKMNVTLEGFYGVRLKKNAELLLTGEYNVPVYAQWKFGKGSVGSFMCDLSGNWSNDFMSDASGARFIKNVASILMPLEDIRPSEINVVFDEQNYFNRLDVYTSLEAGETVTGKIIELSADGAPEHSLSEVGKDVSNSACYVAAAFSAENNYSRCDLVIKAPGTYKIVVEKRSANGEVIATDDFYKTFSYSSEYDIFAYPDQQEIDDKLAVWAKKGNGEVIADLEDPVEIFKDFVTDVVKSFDPRTLFLIIAIVLFLIDIAVRKFKFKWPHEIIRAIKEKKNGK